MAETMISLALAAITFTIGVRSWMGKGFLLNNAYLFASEQERKTMDKKPYYRQSAIVFCLLGVLFSLIVLAKATGTGWLYYIVGAVAFVTLAYVIASSVKEATKSKSP